MCAAVCTCVYEVVLGMAHGSFVKGDLLQPILLLLLSKSNNIHVAHTKPIQPFLIIILLLPMLTWTCTCRAVTCMRAFSSICLGSVSHCKLNEKVQM